MSEDEDRLSTLAYGYDSDGVLALAPVLEAILMVVDRPVSPQELGDVLDIAPSIIEQILEYLACDYRGEILREGEQRRPARGFELRNVAGGWRIYSSRQWADVVGRFIVGSGSTRLSQAALETLAVIAYRQPVSRARISHIRGVNVDGVVRTLVARGLIEEVSQTDSGAYLYGTTSTFLERMGFDSVDDLIPLAPYLPPKDQLEELEQGLEE